MKITFLSDNKTEKSKCLAEWGLSILVESKGHKLLFDVGASPIFARNAKKLGVELTDVEYVAISHGHYDHTDGMEAFCDINQKASIYIHKDAIDEDYALYDDGSIEDVNYGIRWSEEFKNAVKPRLILTEGVTKINDNMTLVGNVPLLKEYPMTEKFFRRNLDGSFRDDPMDHEQFLVVEEDEGIYVISGCSHKGVMSIIARVKDLFPNQRILGFIAGMHLYPLSVSEQKKVVDTICNLNLDCVFPVHCTGMESIIMFKERLGDKCIIASAGESYDC